MKKNLIFTPFLLSLFIFTFSFGNDSTPPIEDWDPILPPTLIEEMQNAPAGSIPSLLMKALDRVTLGSFSVGKSKIKLKLQRKVFDNNDLANTWTVLDRIEINGKTPIIDKVQGSTLLYGFYLGAIHHIDFYNARQVTPEGYKDIPSLDKNKNEIEKSDWYQLHQDDGSEEPIELASGLTTDRLIDFDDILNRLKFPLKIPLKVESLAKLADGEIISYSATGGVMFGVGVGWMEDPLGVLGRLRAGVQVGALLSGIYQISIQKENAQFAQVNVARVKSIGSELKAGIEIKPDILEGIFLVERLSGQLEIIPFEFTAQKLTTKNFNVTYRYDITKPQAQEAYEAAVKGNFKISEDLTQDKEGNPIDVSVSGVEKIQTEKKRTDDTILKTRIKLAFLFKKENKKEFSKIETVLTSPEGTKKVFQVASQQSKEYQLFQNKHQKLTHTFTVNVDLDAQEKNPKVDPLQLMVASRVEDERTRDDKMMAYILNLEDTISRFGLFVRPPHFSKPEDSIDLNMLKTQSTPIAFPRNHLRNSRFYSQIKLNSDQVNHFIYLSDEEMWKALEVVYGVKPGAWQTEASRIAFENNESAFSMHSIPFFASEIMNRDPSALKEAKTFHKNWLEIRATEKDIKQKAIALARLFHKTKGKYEATKLLRVIHDQEKSTFIASGFSPIFGRVRLWGDTQLRKEDIATLRQQDLDRNHRNDGSSSRIVDLKINKLNENQYEVTFNLPKKPQFMSFHLLLEKKWWKIGESEKQSQLLVPNLNSEFFKEGTNKIILDTQDTQSPWFELAKSIKAKREYTLVLSSNPDGFSWGPTYSVDF